MIKTSVLVVGLLAASAWQGAYATALFVPGNSFTVSGSGSPDDFSDSVPLTPGTYALDGGALNLTVSIVSGGGSNEWLSFDYNTASGGPLSPTGGYWSLNQVGLDAAVPVNFIAAYGEFTVNGVAQTPSYSFFGGYSVVSNPVPGQSGKGLGASGFSSPLGSGPLGSLGAYIDPWSGYLDGVGINSTTVNGWEQALEFTPTNPTSAVPEASTWAMMILGFAGLGFAGCRQRRNRQAMGTA